MLDEVGTNLGLATHTITVLSRDKNGRQTHWATIDIFKCHLGLAVWAKVRDESGLAHFSEALSQTMSQPNWKRHEIRRVVARIAEHHSLVASTLTVEDVFATLATAALFADVDTLCDVGALRVECNNNTTGVAVETVCSIVISDALDCFASNCRNVNICIGGDFTRDNTQTSGEQCLTCNTAVWVDR